MSAHYCDVGQICVSNTHIIVNIAKRSIEMHIKVLSKYSWRPQLSNSQIHDSATAIDSKNLLGFVV